MTDSIEKAREKLRQDIRELAENAPFSEEQDHIKGDEILCSLLMLYGEAAVVEDFLSLERWYA